MDTQEHRQYHVIVINEKTGIKEYMTTTPVTHKEGCTLLSKITDYEWRRKQLEEIKAYNKHSFICLLL